MPFIDHHRGKAYYRHWAATQPRAAVVDAIRDRMDDQRDVLLGAR
jgi:hypothetical protein